MEVRKRSNKQKVFTCPAKYDKN